MSTSRECHPTQCASWSWEVPLAPIADALPGPVGTAHDVRPAEAASTGLASWRQGLSSCPSSCPHPRRVTPGLTGKGPEPGDFEVDFEVGLLFV